MDYKKKYIKYKNKYLKLKQMDAGMPNPFFKRAQSPQRAPQLSKSTISSIKLPSPPLPQYPPPPTLPSQYPSQYLSPSTLLSQSPFLSKPDNKPSPNIDLTQYIQIERIYETSKKDIDIIVKYYKNRRNEDIRTILNDLSLSDILKIKKIISIDYNLIINTMNYEHFDYMYPYIFNTQLYIDDDKKKYVLIL